MPIPTTVFAFVWHFLKPKKFLLVICAIVAVVWSVELSLTPYFLKLIIDGVSKHLTNPKDIMHAIYWPAILYFSMSIIININFRVYDYASMLLAKTIYTDTVETVYGYVTEHAYQFFQENFAGRIASKISNLSRDVDQIFRALNENFIPKALALIIASAMLLLVQPIFSLILLVWALGFMLMTTVLAVRSNHYATEFSESYSRLDGHVVDGISHVITAKIFANLKYERNRIHHTQDRVNRKFILMQKYNLKLHALQGVGVSILIGAMLYVLISERQKGLISIGDFVFVLTIAASIINNVWNIAQLWVNFSRSIGACRANLSVMRIPHAIQDKPGAINLTVRRGEIVYQNVCFSYRENTPILNNLSVAIPAGQKVGLVGYSGGGKSTFVNLILRLYNIQSGEIYIDGTNILDATTDSLRKNIAYIPQEPELFHRTVYENILYGDLEADREAIIDASKKAHCHEFVMDLPDGYDTLVGERGVRLSGGQRQRIAIARAILKRAPILILDEATSALDSVTEKYIQDSLHHMMQGKTTIVIAHRLSTLLEMDRILLFQEGKIIEDGTLDALREQKDGVFAKLWAMQGGGYLPEL